MGRSGKRSSSNQNTFSRRPSKDVYTHVDREEQTDAIRKLRAPGDEVA